jgi:hypothetical protein
MVKWFSEKYNSERIYGTPGVFSVLIYNTGQFYEHSGFQANVKQDQQIPSRQVSMVNIFQENHRAFHLNMHVIQVHLLLQIQGRHRPACKIKRMDIIRANNP